MKSKGDIGGDPIDLVALLTAPRRWIKLVDCDGRIVRKSENMGRIGVYGLSESQGRLRHKNALLDEMLQRKLEEAVKGALCVPSAPMLIPGAAGQQLAVDAQPLPPAFTRRVDRARALVTLSVVDDQEQVLGKWLAERHGLTRKEVALSIAMLQHGDIKRYAKDAAVKEASARQGLKNVFSKEGLHSQPQLVAYLSGLARGRIDTR